jgi:hypothetical protein
VTGKGLAAAYAEYLQKYEITLKKPVSMCSFPNDMP